MKRVKIYDQAKYKWALDSALDALGREDRTLFMARVEDMVTVSNASKVDTLYMFAQSAYLNGLSSDFVCGGHK